MTEAEWLTSEDPLPMMRFLDGKLSDRKLRLFLCGGCRRVWTSLSLKSMREAVEAAERFADGAIGADELGHVIETAVADFARFGRRNFHKMTPDPTFAVKGFKMTLAVNATYPDPKRLFAVADLPIPDDESFRMMVNPALLRCVAGNPFRAVAFDPRWRIADAVDLARGIYEERAFDRLPLLADALMDAGCDSDDVLSHCRSEGPHVRGCWVVDLVLGKE
jgi:hypothetical protein